MYPGCTNVIMDSENKSKLGWLLWQMCSFMLGCFGAVFLSSSSSSSPVSSLQESEGNVEAQIHSLIQRAECWLWNISSR